MNDKEYLNVLKECMHPMANILNGDKNKVSPFNNVERYGVNKALNDEILCQDCQKMIKYNDQPEVAMGAIKCPYCGATINQLGEVLNK